MPCSTQPQSGSSSLKHLMSKSEPCRRRSCAGGWLARGCRSGGRVLVFRDRLCTGWGDTWRGGVQPGSNQRAKRTYCLHSARGTRNRHSSAPGPRARGGPRWASPAGPCAGGRRRTARRSRGRCRTPRAWPAWWARSSSIARRPRGTSGAPRPPRDRHRTARGCAGWRRAWRGRPPRRCSSLRHPCRRSGNLWTGGRKSWFGGQWRMGRE